MWRKVVRVLVLAVVVLALPAVAGAWGVVRAVGDVYPARAFGSGADAASSSVAGDPFTIDPDRPTVAIVLGEEGANVADVLPPYEVFAASGRFNVLTVAPTDRPVTLTGGLDLVPDLGFAELDDALAGPPDVIVVPQIHGSTSRVIDWLREQRAAGAPLLMSVCVGAGVLAEAGLLEDRPATSHWLGLIGLRRDHPEVRWTEGVRFVDDGDIITTAGVLRGVDGSLRVLERLVGADVAERVAEDLSWRGYRPGSSVPLDEQDPAPGDLVALLSAAYRWDRPTTGVLLTDGVGEIELASAFRPYTELSYLSRLTAVSIDGAPVRSRHGLVLLPRSDWASAEPQVDRVLTLGSTSSDALGGTAVPVTELHRPGEFPFDGALRDIADTYDTATAQWVARSLHYPMPPGSDGRAAVPWQLMVRPLVLAGPSLVVGVLLLRRLNRTGVSRRARMGRTDETSQRHELMKGIT